MIYRDKLNKFRKEFGGNSLLEIQIANEVESCFYPVKLDDNDFEKLCAFVESIYLKTEEISLEEVINGAYYLMEERQQRNKDYSIDDLINVSYRDFLSRML